MRALNNIAIILFSLFIFFMPIASAQQTVNHSTDYINTLIENVSVDSLEHNITTLAAFHTRHTFSGSIGDTAGIDAALQWAKDEFNRYGSINRERLTADFHDYIIEPYGDKISDTVYMKNVIAELPGTDRGNDAFILISAHIDSRASGLWDNTAFAPGANDDASGVALLLETARILSAEEFPVTIKFALFTGEEQGLYGSAAYAEMLKQQGANLIALFNYDMVGNSTSSGTNLLNNTKVRIFSEGVPLYQTEEEAKLRRYTGTENESPSRELARYIIDNAAPYVNLLEPVPVFRRDRFLRSGDHIPFNRRGFTAVRITEMNENYERQHQNVRTEDGIEYGDLPKFIDYNYLKKITALNIAAVASLASAPPPPDNVKIDVSALSNSTTLFWDSPADSNPEGYYVLMRETYYPFWQKKFFTKETRITLPFSKDNYYFAVQSVSEEGFVSLPELPEPWRGN